MLRALPSLASIAALAALVAVLERLADLRPAPPRWILRLRDRACLAGQRAVARADALLARPEEA